MRKAIIVTGSTKGIGRAIALRMLDSGYFVYINYLHDECAALQLKEQLDMNGHQNDYSIVRADISCMAGIKSFIQQIRFESHELYGVVLNASTNGSRRSTFRNITEEEMTEMFQTNLFSSFFLIQQLADHIKSYGSIVFISSHVGIYPHSTYIPYGLTKAAEIFLSKMLVKEFEERNITVNAVAPAFIETNMFPGTRTKDHLDSIREKIAVHRFGQADEVAAAVMSLIENHYINGSVLSIDGGYNYK